MKNRILVGVSLFLSMGILSACSSRSKDADVITMKGDTITVVEFYDKVKNNSSAQQVLLEMTIAQVFNKKYGDRVTEKEVTDAYNENVAIYGNSFSQVLQQAGMDIKSYREKIKTNKLVEYAVRKAAEKKITDEDYQAAYDEYTPEVTVQLIKLSEEDKANSVLDKAKNGADFTQLVKGNSIDEQTKERGGKVKFDSAASHIPTELKTATFSLEVGNISDIIKTTDPTTYQPVYYIVKLNKKSEKSTNLSEYKSRLKEIILVQQQNDTSFVKSIVSKELNSANIKVKDAAFQGLFSQYAQENFNVNGTHLPFNE